ncbi:MAG TPA: ice-binding family protein [Thermoanaerobaculia bacterium]|jgi:hypothetical protein
MKNIIAFLPSATSSARNVTPERQNIIMKKTSTGLLAAIGIALLFPSVTASAQIALDTAENFAVLAGSAVTNTGATVVSGEVGVSPGSSVTGFPPGVIVNGTIHAADAVAGQAQTDLTDAYNTAAGIACTTNLTGQNLGGLTLTPGVYCFDSSAALTGTLTLDLQGNPNAFFLFKIGSTLTTASGSSVVLTNAGGTGCPANVFFQVGSSATFGTGSTFVGNVLALTSITLTTGTNLNGRVLARNGAVTLDTNNVTSCAAAPACPTITVNPASLPGGTVGSAYNQTLTASGSPGPFTFTVTSGALPNGLTLNSTTGALTGVPTVAATSNFTITATDAALCSGQRAFSIIIAPAAPGEVAPVPALDYAGIAVLAIALGAAALFVMSRTS